MLFFYPSGQIVVFRQPNFSEITGFPFLSHLLRWKAGVRLLSFDQIHALVSYRFFFPTALVPKKVFNLKNAASFWTKKPLPLKMVVKHSIKQNGGLPGQDMSSFHLRFQQFFGPQNAEVMHPKTLAFGLISVAKDVAVLADQNEAFGVWKSRWKYFVIFWSCVNPW